MKRRTFIKNTGILSTASLLPLASCSEQESSKYKMGLQLYSINDDMNNDPISTLKAVKKMGYRDFEIYGFDDEKVSYYGLDAQELKKKLEDLELTVT
ncbi:MAG: sugar phosphate isomerase/epimerase, partial [Bacteroidota bacterium]